MLFLGFQQNLNTYLYEPDWYIVPLVLWPNYLIFARSKVGRGLNLVVMKVEFTFKSGISQVLFSPGPTPPS